jgi:hypothetical protein
VASSLPNVARPVTRKSATSREPIFRRFPHDLIERLGAKPGFRDNIYIPKRNGSDMKALFSEFVFSAQRRLVRAAAAVLAAGVVVTVAPLTYAAEMLRMEARLPFSFNLGDKTMPAGRYSVQIDHSSHRLIFRNATEYVSVGLAAGSAYRDANDATEGRLMFDEYGTAHVLRKVWLNGESKGYVIPATKAERELSSGASTRPAPTTIALD